MIHSLIHSRQVSAWKELEMCDDVGVCFGWYMAGGVVEGMDIFPDVWSTGVCCNDSEDQKYAPCEKKGTMGESYELA